jgi:glutamate-1-semialdehyde 2,1-aminomutase
LLKLVPGSVLIPDMSTASMTLSSALEAARERYARANPESRRLHQEASRHLPGGNTRTVLFHSPFPLRFVHAEGSRLRDADGHEYVDFLSEYTAGVYGHSHPVIRRAVEEALAFGLNIGGHSLLELRFAEAVRARFPNLELVRFTNSGTEANLMAIVAARAFTRREKVMVFSGAYHGGVLYFRHGGHAVNAPFPFVLAPYNDTAGTLELVERHRESLAAILIEPLQGGTGCIPARREFLSALREAATRTGALLVFDEVMTSRLAPGGLAAVHGIVPDLTTIGKYVGGGMSFGGFGGRSEIMSVFDPSRPDALPHAGTFNNNTLTLCAGYRGLTEAFTEEAQIEMNAQFDRLRDRLNELARKARAAMQFTGRGSMMAVHFCDGEIACEADADRGDPSLVELFFFDLLAAGYYIARRGMFAGSLVLGDAECEGLASAVEAFLEERGELLRS